MDTLQMKHDVLIDMRGSTANIRCALDVLQALDACPSSSDAYFLHDQIASLNKALADMDQAITRSFGVNGK